MEAQNLLKGQVLEGLIETIFKRARYQVVPLGVEHQFPDIDALTFDEYKEKLPEGLKMLPDFMVYRWSSGTPKVFFIEVKGVADLRYEGLGNRYIPKFEIVK